MRIALQQILPVGILLAGVSSCSVSQTIAGETDGVYFDPSTDQKPVYTSSTDEYYSSNEDETLVRIGGKYFDRNGNAPIIEKQTNTYNKKKNRNNQYADWGEEDNSNLNVSVNYFGSPFYSGFGWGMSYGYGSGAYYNPYNPWGGYSPYFNSGIYWNSPYYGYTPFYNSWNPFYSPYYNYGSYYGFYNRYYPYYGYGGYGYYGNSYYPTYYRTRPIQRGRVPSSNDVDVYRNTQRYNSGIQNSRIQNSRVESSNRQIRRTYSADNDNSRYQRVRERSVESNNNQSRIRYNRSSDSNWGNSRSYTPSTNTRSNSNSSSGRVRFK
ncbi:hypothetical protein KRX57_01695 [Weeksellaceae bacterium TAE3-ERU29]|nr:hypothetical protein [Weeksellaceae bacterium TAE3-ERU29]